LSEAVWAWELSVKKEARPRATHRLARRVDFIDPPPKDSFHSAWTFLTSLNMAIFASGTFWKCLKINLIANVFDNFFLFPFSPRKRNHKPKRTTPAPALHLHSVLALN
jgi:hypothetical protein